MALRERAGPRTLRVTDHASLLFVLEQAASGAGPRRVDRVLVLVNVPDDAVLVHHEGRAIRESLLTVEDPVILRGGPLKVAQQRKRDADLIGKGFVGRWAVHADSEDLRSVCFEFGDIRLIRLQLLRSATGKSQDVKRENYIFLPQKITEADFLPVGVGQREVGCFVSHLELNSGSPRRKA